MELITCSLWEVAGAQAGATVPILPEDFKPGGKYQDLPDDFECSGRLNASMSEEDHEVLRKEAAESMRMPLKQEEHAKRLREMQFQNELSRKRACFEEQEIRAQQRKEKKHLITWTTDFADRKKCG